MDHEYVESQFELRARACALLRWLDEKAAADPSVLSNDVIAALGSPAACVAWIRERRPHLPPECLPKTREADVLTRYARHVGALLAMAFAVVDGVIDLRIEKRVTRRIVPRPRQTCLRPEASIATKTYLRWLAHTQGLALKRAEIDDIVDDLRWPLRAPLVYCACVDAAVCAEDITDSLPSALALWSEMPDRARWTLCAEDYYHHLDILVKHLRVAYRTGRDESPADVRY